MRSFLPLAALALALAFGLEADAAPKRAEPTKSAESRVSRAAKRAHRRLDALLKEKGLAFGDPVFVRVFKEEAELELWLRHGERFELLKTYAVCAASGELGPKERVGDEQVPEGFYAVPASAMNPASNYHLAFNVGYPNALDKKLGRTGSLIMIHGDCVSIGCLAMTDDGIEEIYSLADAAHKQGQASFAVQLLPFRMTRDNMKRHKGSRWKSLWESLKPGYDSFESKHVPPSVRVEGGRYVVSDG